MTEQAQPTPFPRHLVHQSSQVRLDYWKRVHGGSSCLESKLIKPSGMRFVSQREPP